MTLTEAFGPPWLSPVIDWRCVPPVGVPLVGVRWAVFCVGYGTAPESDERQVVPWQFWVAQMPAPLFFRFATSPHVEVWHP